MDLLMINKQVSDRTRAPGCLGPKCRIFIHYTNVAQSIFHWAQFQSMTEKIFWSSNLKYFIF